MSEKENHPGCRHGKIVLYHEYYILVPAFKGCPECHSRKSLGQDGNGNVVCACRHIYEAEKV